MEIVGIVKIHCFILNLIFEYTYIYIYLFDLLCVCVVYIHFVFILSRFSGIYIIKLLYKILVVCPILNFEVNNFKLI